MRKKLEELDSQEKKIDNEIANINNQIKEEYLNKQEFKPYHYITYEDCINICKSMNKNEHNKTMIIISAPKGSSLEVVEEEKG